MNRRPTRTLRPAGRPPACVMTLPAARLGDPTVHGGTITVGCPTVLVGNAGGGGGGGFAGVAGAVLGGLVAGLRNLVSDEPKAPLQPDGTWVTQYNDSIQVEGTPEFQAQTVRDLHTISATPSGKKLMASMTDSGKQCRIHTDNNNGNWAWTDPNPPTAGQGSNGNKVNTEIGYSPTRTSLTGPPGSPYNTAPWAQAPNRPADVGLFHEMVHADDMMNGRIPTTQGTNTGARAGTPIADAELRAVGLPPFAGESYSENTYRADRKLPPRTFY